VSQRTLNQILCWLRRAVGPRPGTDAELLHEYVLSQDEAVFTEILRRHGPLVWRVCRQLVRHEQDAEDGFQATFLVLARQAASIRKGEALASWLFGVAQHSSRVVLRRKRRQPPRTSARLADDPALQAGSAELCDLILEAVRQLPEEYRMPLVGWPCTVLPRGEARGTIPR
jgi:RNA polymerase sigma factor (sigma-70 family)